MKKKYKLLTIISIIFTFFFIGKVNASALSFSQTASQSSVYYASGAHSAAFKYSIGGQDVSDGSYNGFCMQPRYGNHDESFSTYTTFEKSNDSTYYYTIPGTSNKLPYRAIMYYAYNAPGWKKNSSTMVSKYSNKFSEHSTYSANVYHTISALPMSYVLSKDSSFSGVTCGYTTGDTYSGTSTACDWNLQYVCNDDDCTSGYNKVNATVNGWESDIKTLLSEMYTLWQTDKSSADGFNVYYHNGGGQDLMVWSYEESTKAYIKVTKDFSPNSTASVTFKLYNCFIIKA